MDIQRKIADQQCSNNKLPDVVIKALITAKLQEFREHMQELEQLDATLEKKKHEYQLLQLKKDMRQKDLKYLKEAEQRSTTRIDNLSYELGLLKSGLSPKYKEMLQEQKMEEEHCWKLKAIWERYEVQWESLPLAKERKEAKSKLLQLQFNLSSLQNKIRFKIIINKYREDIDEKRLQLAIIQLAESFVRRQKMEKEFNTIKENNEELKLNLAILKEELQNKAYSVLKSKNSARFLMPPPSSNFVKKAKEDYYDTISVNTVVWEDLFPLSNAPSSPSVSSNITHINSQEVNPILKEKDSYLEIESLLPRQKSFNLQAEVNNRNKVQERSSNVGDDMERSLGVLESPYSNYFQKENDCAISLNSGILDDICNCSSSSTVLETHPKQPGSLNLGNRFEKSDFNRSITRNDSMELSKNNNEPKERASSNVPLVKSVEKVTTNLNFFDNNLNRNPAMNMFSSQFIMKIQQPNNSVQENVEKIGSQEKEKDNFNDNDSEVKNVMRAISPISGFQNMNFSTNFTTDAPTDMDTDNEEMESNVSKLSFSKMCGNVSPLSEMGKMDFDRDFSMSQTSTEFTHDQKEKDQEKSIYSKFQETNFMKQSNQTDFFALFK